MTIVATCPHCGLTHPGPCHRIKAIEYYPDGTVKRVEYVDHAETGTVKHQGTITIPWPGTS